MTSSLTPDEGREGRRPLTMDDAATRLGISRRRLQDLVKDHPFYAANGARKLFSESHIARLYRVLRDTGAAPVPIPDLELDYIGYQKPLRPNQGHIYFLSAGGYIKIGFARDLKQRIAQLSTACPFPITVLRVIPGTLADEGTLHHRFREHRHHLEWFRHEGKLAEFIAEKTR